MVIIVSARRQMGVAESVNDMREWSERSRASDRAIVVYDVYIDTIRILHTK